MDLKKRTFAKAMTWQITGFFMMIAIGFFHHGIIERCGRDGGCSISNRHDQLCPA